MNDESFGLSAKERRKLQRQAIEDDNSYWEKDMSAKNKTKAGINEETINDNWLKVKTKEDQIKYFGGVKGKWALLESGIAITNDSQLEKRIKMLQLNEKTGQLMTLKN